MKKTYYHARQTISKTGRIGWTQTPMVMVDGKATRDLTKPVIYCQGATTQTEADNMINGAGKTTFSEITTITDPNTGVESTLESYQYGQIIVREYSAPKAGGSRTERLAALLAAEAAPLGKIEKKLNKA